jgi:hypothetical protein
MATGGNDGDGVSRADVEKAFDELREKLKLPSPASIAKRRAELKRQAREIVKKFGKAKEKL